MEAANKTGDRARGIGRRKLQVARRTGRAQAAAAAHNDEAADVFAASPFCSQMKAWRAAPRARCQSGVR